MDSVFECSEFEPRLYSIFYLSQPFTKVDLTTRPTWIPRQDFSVIRRSNARTAMLWRSMLPMSGFTRQNHIRDTSKLSLDCWELKQLSNPASKLSMCQSGKKALNLQSDLKSLGFKWSEFKLPLYLDPQCIFFSF